MRNTLGLLSWWPSRSGAASNFGPHYYRLGNEAEINKNWDEAIQYYEKAIVEKPNEYAYKMALTRVRLIGQHDCISDPARKLVVQGKKDEAVKEYEKALVL